jgi:hypothetical protein
MSEFPKIHNLTRQDIVSHHYEGSHGADHTSVTTTLTCDCGFRSDLTGSPAQRVQRIQDELHKHQLQVMCEALGLHFALTPVASLIVNE